jgi:hypothetical protein
MTKNSISYSIFILLIFITSFQFSAWGITGEIYSILRILIIATISILFVFNYSKSIKYYRHISLLKIHFWGLLIFTFALLLLLPLGLEINFSPARDLALTLVVLLIGLNMEIKEKQFKRLINFYIVLYTLAALSIVFSFASGFVIHEQYLSVPKNQVSPAFGVAFILSLYFSFKNKGPRKWFYYVFAGLLFASLLVIRGRAVLVAVFLTVLIFIFYFIKSKKYKVITIISGVLLFPYIWQYIYDAIFLNFDVSDLDSISTGRMESYQKGVDFFLKFPLGGQLENSNFRGRTVHNYILYNLVNYGFIIGSLLLVIYFKYVFKTIKSIRLNSFQYFEVGPLVMVILFVISLFEYAYPYAPGSAIFFPFFLMGQYLQKQNTL